MEGHQPVRPVRPPAPYLGGKRRLAPAILPWIDGAPHKTYAEPFVGMGGLFLQRRSRPPAEVINDLNRDVATFFRVLQRHYTAFVEHMRFRITSRAEFERLRKVDPDTLTDLERSARFLYLQHLAYGGQIDGVFGVDRTASGGFNLTRLGPILDEVHTRLAGVVVECLDWSEFIVRYDGPETLFYLDPPYWGGERDYLKDGFARADFTRMARQLAGIQGRFVLSINDVPETRRLFADFTFDAVDYRYTVNKDQQHATTDLIVMGPPGREWKKAGQGALSL